MKETFKTIVNYPDYEISNLGRIKTKERLVRYTHSVTEKEHFRKTDERFLKIYHNNRTGYKFVQLYNNGKSKNYTIHRLVAENFIDNKNHLNTVNHIDGNKHNNTSMNLEWCSNSYNHKHATETGLKAKGTSVNSSKLNDNCVTAIKYFLNKGFTHKELSIAFDISRPTISLISNGKTWKHIALTNEELTIK
jgi:hypothetical protein